jgi:hypothetical protein
MLGAWRGLLNEELHDVYSLSYTCILLGWPNQGQ